MVPAAPILYFSGVPADAAFIAQLAPRLQARGLTVVDGARGAVAPSANEALQRCAVCCVVVSPASMRSADVRQAYTHALSQGKPVIPLITRSGGDLDPALKPLQWIDFSQSAYAGWLDLLMTLDTMGIARFPAPHIPYLDWDLALARAYRGRMPYNWRAYRISEHYYRRQARDQINLVFFIIPGVLCLMGALLGSMQWTHIRLLAGSFGGILILGTIIGYTGWRCFKLVAVARQQYAQVNDRSEILIITPEGFGVRTADQTIVAQFSEVAEIRPEVFPVNPNVSTTARSYAGLEIRYRSGQSVRLQLEPRFTPGMVTYDQVAGAFRAYALRQQSAPLVQPAPSRLFISHARKDYVETDLLDMALQRHGYQTWVDRNMLTGGQSWSDELARAIADCTAVVVCVSPASLASPVVRQEYEYALKLGKPVLAVRLRRGGRAPDGLQRLMCADFTRGVERSLRRGLCPLALALDRVGVRAAADDSGFNALLALARALAGEQPAGWHVVRPRSLWRTGWFLAMVAIALVIVLASLPLAALWNVILAAAVGYLGLMVGAYAIYLLYVRASGMQMIVTTPAGFLLQEDATSTQIFPFARYSAIHPGAPRPGRAYDGRLALTLAATGRTTTFIPWIIYAERLALAQQILADFLCFQTVTRPQRPTQPM